MGLQLLDNSLPFRDSTGKKEMKKKRKKPQTTNNSKQHTSGGGARALLLTVRKEMRSLVTASLHACAYGVIKIAELNAEPVFRMCLHEGNGVI